MNSNTLDAHPSAVYGTSSSRSFLSQNLVYTVAPLRPEFFQMWYIQENWAQKSCLYHCSIKTGVFPDVVFSRLLNLKGFSHVFSGNMPSRFSIAGHGVQRARENYVCCTHSKLRIYKLVKLNVCVWDGCVRGWGLCIVIAVVL